MIDHLKTSCMQTVRDRVRRPEQPLRAVTVIHGAVMLWGLLAALFLAGCRPPATPVPEDAIAVNIAFMVDEGFHDGEAYMPLGYLTNRGARVTVIGPRRGIVGAYNSDFTILIEKTVAEVDAADFDALVLPGGQAPARLREHQDAVRLAREFFELNKIVAAICHGPQVLITAGVMDGVTATGVGGIRDELEEAGASYVDQSVVIHDNLITSRLPQDLYNFSAAIEQAVLAPPPLQDPPVQP